VKRSLLVLCGVGAGRNARLPSLGPVRAEPPGFIGLPWGVGDPAVAGLHRPDWAVVRIPSPVEAGPASVSFTEGEVLYAGDPRGALETLLAYGADAARMSVQLALPGVGGLARIGDYGVAVGGTGGLAQAGRFGRAIVGTGGVAVAGVRGGAVAQWSRGVAVCGAEGTAEAGDEGMAFATGHGAAATAGAFGIAAATARAGQLLAGEHGLVVALRGAWLMQVAGGGIAVSLDAIAGRDRVAVAAGGLAVLRLRTDDGGVCFATLIEADHQAAGGTPLIFWQGRWQAPDAVPENRRPAAPAADEPDTAAVEAADDEAMIPVITLQPDEVLVLCAVPAAIAGDENMRAENWDPDPSSDSGFVGLLWGEGDAHRGGLAWGDAWALVRVPASSVVGERHRNVGVVRFPGGPICYCGERRGALRLLLALGRKPTHLIGQVATAGADGVAVTRSHGAARAGPRGWAIAWSNAEAEAARGGVAHAGADSVARAGADGIAMAGEASTGSRGIAISLGKRYGTAAAGDRGIAVGAGRFKQVRVGDGGAAIATSHGALIEAGDDAVAIGSGRVRGGRNGVAIATDGTVSGGEGCLLVRRWQDQDGQWRYAIGIAGQGGIEAWRPYDVAEGRLRLATVE
jgi:hypothetical protein